MAPQTSPSSTVSTLHHSIFVQKTVPSLLGHPFRDSSFPQPKFTLSAGIQRNPRTRCRSWRTSSGYGNCPLEGDRDGDDSPALAGPAQPACRPERSSRLPEELRFRERLAASPRPVTAARGRVWRALEMDGPSPLPPLPIRFRCCCCLGNGKGDTCLCVQLLRGRESLHP